VLAAATATLLTASAGHGLSGTSYGASGDGKTIPSVQIPNRYDQLGLLFDWVENDKAPGMAVTVTAGDRSLPLCSHPSYPRYRAGDPASASLRMRVYAGIMKPGSSSVGADDDAAGPANV
jgi:hypothetical protein